MWNHQKNELPAMGVIIVSSTEKQSAKQPPREEVSPPVSSPSNELARFIQEKPGKACSATGPIAKKAPEKAPRKSRRDLKTHKAGEQKYQKMRELSESAKSVRFIEEKPGRRDKITLLGSYLDAINIENVDLLY